jgi:NAD(P)H-hydrate epimerase
MAGSISLSGKAALRSGAGLVTVATADVCQSTVAGFEPALMTAALPSDAEGRISTGALDKVRELSDRATMVGCGPGLGHSAEITALVVGLYRELRLPMVVDADGLNALSSLPDVGATHAGPRILTPHPGEFARLVRKPHLRTADAITDAVALAARYSAIVVLKGHRTLVTDGSRQYINSTGNAGMATGGTGDVLTGIITGLLGQGLAAFEAAQLGVYIHGLAGDLAAEKLGELSLIASDLLDYLPAAFRQAASAS